MTIQPVSQKSEYTLSQSHQALVNAAREKGFEVWISGSDDTRDLEHATARGISGVIVYEPENVVEHFDGRTLKAP